MGSPCVSDLYGWKTLGTNLKGNEGSRMGQGKNLSKEMGSPEVQPDPTRGSGVCL